MRAAFQLVGDSGTGSGGADRLNRGERRWGEGLRVESGKKVAESKIAPPVFKEMSMYWDNCGPGYPYHCSYHYRGIGDKMTSKMGNYQQADVNRYFWYF